MKDLWLETCNQNFGSILILLPIYRIYYLCIQTHFIIATDKLNIDGLKKTFKGKETFETNDVIRFYKKEEPQIKIATVNWRIYHWSIHRVERFTGTHRK